MEVNMKILQDNNDIESAKKEITEVGFTTLDKKI